MKLPFQKISKQCKKQTLKTSLQKQSQGFGKVGQTLKLSEALELIFSRSHTKWRVSTVQIGISGKNLGAKKFRCPSEEIASELKKKAPNDIEETSDFLKAFAKEFENLDPVEKDIWQAFADSGDYELSAAELGRELGLKYKNGVPIPAATIRQTKRRAKLKLIGSLKGKGFDMSEWEDL